MTARLIKNTIDEYHAKDGHYSKSVLSDMLDCPAVFKYWHIDGHSKPPRDHLNIGNAVHTLAIEPELFKERYAVLPDGMRRDKRIKEYQAFCSENPGKDHLTANDYESIKRMADALSSDPTSRTLLGRKGMIEHSIYWEDDETGLKFKVRPDHFSEDVVVDIKTDRDVRPNKFMYQAEEWGYDLSVALTNRAHIALTGKPLANYIFLLVDKSEPHIVEAYDAFRIHDDCAISALDKGEARLGKVINDLLECQATGIWPKYNKTPITPLKVRI
jgi:hypothetical protein